MVLSGPAVQFGIVAVTVVGLWLGARLLVDASVRLARGLGLSELVIGLTIVALGTSMPELAVSTEAAYKGLGDLAIANVLGSNVYNLAFILGVVAAVRAIPIERSLIRRNGLALLGSTLVGVLVLADRTVTSLEGLALVVLFVGYTTALLRTGPASASTITPDAVPKTRVVGDVVARLDIPGRNVLPLVGGLVLVVVSGDLMIAAATDLALAAGVSEWVIGGTIVAAGTSTPEFAVSLVAVQRGSTGVSVGNIIGSNVFNLVGIVGVAALIRPLVVAQDVFGTLAWLVAISVVAVAALWTGRVLSRLEGVLLATSELVRWLLNLIA